MTLFQDLRVTLGEKESLLKEVEKEREVWRQRDQALATVLQEKEALIRCLKEELERHQKGAQVIIQPLEGYFHLAWETGIYPKKTGRH